MGSKYLKTVVIVFCTWIFLSCDKDSDDDKLLVDKAEVSAILIDNQWKISYYYDDKDETSDYNGYVLTFQESGGILATNGDTSVTGTWSIADSDASDNSTDGSVELNIYFANPAIFEELTDDWDILTYASGKIELRDVSGGDGTTDLLTFEKM